MTTLLAFVVTLGLLIIVHEYGHYIVARACGVKVLRFSVGFGPVVGRRIGRGGTEWALSAIPLGGYVKMLDEREGDVGEADLPLAFNRKRLWQRALIVAAGPLANFLLAILLYWGLYVHGVTVLRPVLAEPPAATPAALAGFGNGETVVAVDGEVIEDWQGLHWIILKRGLDGDVLRVETRDRQGHLHERRLDLAGVDLADAGEDPLGRIGLGRYLPELPPVLGEIVGGGRAEAAGLRSGDRVLEVDGQSVAQWTDLVQRVRASPERPLRLTVERQGDEIGVTLTPQAAEDGATRIGRIGVAPQLDPALLETLRAEVRFGPGESLQRSLHKTWELSAFTLRMLGRLLVGEASLKHLSGPVTIADYAGRSAEAGLTAFVAFLALISISLGVLNLLPIPLLDGGHLLYYFAEFLSGRPVPDSVQETGQKIGAVLLGALMFLALFNDFQRLLGG